MNLNKKTVFLIGLSCLFTLILSVRSLSSFKVVFCDVGQGAATFIQLGSYQALIDTGPDGRVLSCIGKHISYFDHTIETVIISHNQKDHNGALLSLSQKYHLAHVYGPAPQPPFLDDSQFTEVKDTDILYQNSLTITIHKASQSSSSINDSANVVTLKTPHQTIFLSSDISGGELKGLMPIGTTILEVPHHGSKYGLFPDSLDLALPTLAVISVGARNTYGHPSHEALDILKAKNIPIWRTDTQGELEINLR